MNCACGGSCLGFCPVCQDRVKKEFWRDPHLAQCPSYQPIITEELIRRVVREEIEKALKQKESES